MDGVEVLASTNLTGILLSPKNFLVFHSVQWSLGMITNNFPCTKEMLNKRIRMCLFLWHLHLLLCFLLRGGLGASAQLFCIVRCGHLCSTFSAICPLFILSIGRGISHLINILNFNFYTYTYKVMKYMWYAGVY